MILNLMKRIVLIGVKELYPGPSGEDADKVSQPRDVGSLGSALVRAGAVIIGALKLDPPTTGLLLQSTCTHWDDNVLCVARGCFGAGSRTYSHGGTKCVLHSSAEFQSGQYLCCRA